MHDHRHDHDDNGDARQEDVAALDGAFIDGFSAASSSDTTGTAPIRAWV